MLVFPYLSFSADLSRCNLKELTGLVYKDNLHFSVIFSMFCIEQAKIYREAKFGSDRARLVVEL